LEEKRGKQWCLEADIMREERISIKEIKRVSWEGLPPLRGVQLFFKPIGGERAVQKKGGGQREDRKEARTFSAFRSG